MEEQIKHRIIGGIVLGMIGLVILPLLLKNTSESRAPMPLSRFALPESPPRPVVEPVNLAEPQLERFQSVALAKVDLASAASVPRTTNKPLKKSGPSRMTPPRVAAATKKAPVPAANSNHLSGASQRDSIWTVQVGFFKEQQYAEKMCEALRKRGYKPIVQRVKISQGNGERFKVLLGPASSKPVAMRSLQRLRTKTGFKGYLVKAQKDTT